MQQENLDVGINFPEFESAGVSSVNGQHTNGNQDHTSTHINNNPYSNANAPPAEHHGIGSNRPGNIDPAYPPYPSNTGSSNSGNYPPYSSNGQKPSQSNNNLGYPPYPTLNRMPQPGNYQPAHYPPNSGYPAYPSNQQPGYNQYSNNPYKKRYNNSVNSVHATNIGFNIIAFCLISKYLT